MSSSNQAPQRRKSKGRQKVSMEKMANQSNLQVTFSKRRAGLFKKASELCTLCGAEAALIVFSPANKVYCFGHPSLQAIIDKFFNDAPPEPTSGTSLMIEAHRNSTLRELNMELTQIESMLKAERIRGEILDQKRKEGEMQHWFPPSFDGFKSVEQLSFMKSSILDITNKMDVKVEKEMFRVANANLFYPPPLPPPSLQMENADPRVFGYSFNMEQPNIPRGVPTYNDPFAVGLGPAGNFSPFGQSHEIGFNNNGTFPQYGVTPTWTNQDPLMTSTGGNGLGSNEHRSVDSSEYEVSNDQLTSNLLGGGYGLMNNGLLGSMLLGTGSNNSNNSSTTPFGTNGYTNFGDGFGTDYGSSMLQ